MASIDRKAYCPGESIILPEIQIENNSNVAIDAVKVKLVQSVLYKARGMIIQDQFLRIIL